MKKLMYVLIAVLVAVATSASADNWKLKKKTVRISVENVAKVPGLTAVVKAQIPGNFLDDEMPLYILRVDYNNAIYIVVGTRAQWLKFLFVPNHTKKSDPKMKKNIE